MSFDHFLQVPMELKVQIIRKCFPIPYVRLRQTCHFVDAFCERSRKELGIYCNQYNPQLDLGNSSWGSPKDFYESPYVTFNYGKKGNDQNFARRMRKENILSIRKSLSGFAFTTLKLENARIPVSKNRKESKQFAGALVSFLQVVADLRVKRVILINLTPAQVKMVTSTWKPDRIDVEYKGNMGDIMEIDAVMNVENLTFTFRNVDKSAILKTINRNGIVELKKAYCETRLARKALNLIIENWNRPGEVRPYIFTYEFVDNGAYFDNDILGEWAPLMPREAVYFRCLRRFVVKQMNEEIRIKDVKLDIWITKLYNRPEKWQLIYVMRYRQSSTTVVYAVRNLFSADHLISYLIDFIQTTFPVIPGDYSTLYDAVRKCRTLEEVKEEFSKTVQFIWEFYREEF